MTSAPRWTGWEHRQDAIEAELARRHLGPEPNPSRMALFDLSSSWLEGRCCPLAPRGYSRDGKKGKLQIEYGLAHRPRGPAGRGRGCSPATPAIRARSRRSSRWWRDKFELAQMVMVGRPRDDHQRPDPGPEPAGRRDAAAGRGRLRVDHRALRAPAIRKLMADGGPLQSVSVRASQDLAEITSPDFPGERLIACRNPVLAVPTRARTREDLLAAIRELLAPVIARVRAGKLTGAGPSGWKSAR